MPEYLTVSEMAARLGISARAVQKRCANGTLAARRVSTPAGERWEVEGANLPANQDASRARTDEPKGREPREPDAVLNSESGRALDANRQAIGREPDANTRELIAEKDARIADLREQIDAWRLQAEAANRTASETAAALRKALDAMPKALPDASTPNAEKTGREDAPQAPIITPGDVSPVAQKQAAQLRAKPRKLTAWQRIGGRILGIRP
jgi:uncharacterized small protein (DUF1192 family)